MKIEAIMKTQTKGILEMKNQLKWTEIKNISTTNKIQEMHGTENLRCWRFNRGNRFINKENVKSTKILNTKHSGNQGQNEKNKPKNNRNRRGIPIQKSKKYIQQHHRRKTFQPKERHVYKGTISLQNIK